MRRPITSALIATAILAAPTAALAVSPADGGDFPAFSVVTINDGPGDQYDPHVSGDDVSYTSGPSIHYYNFSTGIDQQVRSLSGVEDTHSGVDGRILAWARFDPETFESYIKLYNIADDRDGTLGGPGIQQAAPAIGASTVAYVDLATSALYAVRIGGPTAQLAEAGQFNFQADVAQSGDLIVWNHCVSGATLCEIRQAAWNGAAWELFTLTSGAAPDQNASTDGTVVVYGAARSGDTDITWQPVGGGAEQRLELPGWQRNPTVSHGLVLFESVAPGAAGADLYLYQISTNRLFRITTTPWNEALNDIDVLPDGRVRVVWSSGNEGERDVYGATIELPPAGPTYNFGGFVSPVDALPTLNQLKAGAAVPVKFSLGANQGLAIFAAGYPKSQSVACDATAPVDGIEVTVNAGASSLTYDSVTGLYTYVWKTDKAWAGTCRQLVLKFADGSSARANFKLK